MKNLVFTATVALSLLSHAAFEPPKTEKSRETQMKIFGGLVEDRRAMKGQIVAVNAQKTADDALLKAAFERFSLEVCVDVRLETGLFDVYKPDLRGEATLFIVDDDRLPMSLVAVESKWAMLNVNKLKSEKKPFFEARVKKEAFRVLSLLCGAGSSKFEQCITGCITGVEGLDNLADISLPLEIKDRFRKYLPGLGITPYKLVPYRTACKEGWAKDPTNDFQKAIWDKVHALPSEPIKIKYTPKK